MTAAAKAIPMAPLAARRLTIGERDRLLNIAKICRAEAQTWREGFAVWDPVKLRWQWDGEYSWAEARAFKLDHAAEYLADFVAQRTP